MALPKRRPTKKDLNDAAYQRMLEQLPGQLTLDGQIVAANGTTQPPATDPTTDGPVADIEDIATCPDCGRTQTADAGWTVLATSVRHPALQCGGCGAIVRVSDENYETVRASISLRFTTRAKPTLSSARANRRDRGAR